MISTTPAFNSFSFMQQKWIDLGEWQWISISLIEWWLQLHQWQQVWLLFLNIWTCPLVPGFQLLVWKMFIPPSMLMKTMRSHCHCLARPAIHPCSYTSDINSLALCYNLTPRNFDHFSLAWHITLVHYTDIITQVICEKQEVANTPDLLER